VCWLAGNVFGRHIHVPGVEVMSKAKGSSVVAASAGNRIVVFFVVDGKEDSGDGVYDGHYGLHV